MTTSTTQNPAPFSLKVTAALFVLVLVVVFAVKGCIFIDEARERARAEIRAEGVHALTGVRVRPQDVMYVDVVVTTPLRREWVDGPPFYDEGRSVSYRWPPLILRHADEAEPQGDDR